MTRRDEPVRTCVGCRVRSAKSDLLRVVVVDGSLIPDLRGRLPGRGAHLHPDPDCLALAERRRAFPRAFRLTGPLDAAPVRDHLAQQAEHGKQQSTEHQQSRPDAGRRKTDERAMSTHR